MSDNRRTCPNSYWALWFTTRCRTACGDGVVPIRGFLAGRTFDVQAINTMSVAFDGACDELGLIKTTEDPATSLVAEKIIEVAQRGVRDPDLLRTMALNELGRG
jgi:hypothetical protein